MKKLLTILQYIGIYLISFVLLSFGLSKFFGQQFVLTNYIEYVPLRYVDDYSLAWAFFERSYMYNFMIGLLEFATGVFILFRRTRLLGLLLALGIYVNIVMVDVFYGVKDAIIHASLELIVILLLLIPYFRALKQFFWNVGGRPDQFMKVGKMRIYQRSLPFVFIVVVVLLNIWVVKMFFVFDDLNGVYEIEVIQDEKKVSLERGPWSEEAVIMFDFDKKMNIMANHRNHWGIYKTEQDSVLIAFDNNFLDMQSIKGVFRDGKITGSDDRGKNVIFHLKKVPK